MRIKTQGRLYEYMGNELTHFIGPASLKNI